MFQRPVRGAIAAVASTLVLLSGGPAGAVVSEPATTATVTPTQQLTSTAKAVPIYGDFDGDGRDDIFWYVAGSGTDILWSGKARTSTTTVDADRFVAQTLPISGSYQAAAGDFDGNGMDDILWYGKGNAADSVWYFTGQGTIVSKSFTINGDYQLHAGNFNTGGTSASADDVFLYGPGYSSLWSGTTSRTFTVTNYASPPPSGAKVYPGNWRQSSTAPGATEHLDLLFYRPGTVSDTIWVGNSTGAFTPSAVTINGTYDPIVGNFDASSNGGPEMHDIFWYAPGTTKDYVWMNTGSSFASEPETVNAKTYKPRVLAARGADERDDILWNNPSGTDFVWKTTGSNGSFTYTSINTSAKLGDPGTRTPLIADLDTGEATGGGSSAGMIDAGGNHTCAVTTTGGAQCWGYNLDGVLGNGTTTNSNVPVNVTGLTSGVEAVAVGYSHSCALTAAGGVKCWGLNIDGQLGNGTNAGSNVPVDVTGLTSGVTAITSGDYHTCALTTGGGAKCWGSNAFGQLGNGTTTNSNVPVDVTGRTSLTAAISAGVSHTCAITTAGAASCWGDGVGGQLGNADGNSSNVPVPVNGLTTGTTAISAGLGHTCAINAGGARCWGRNSSGQLGNGNTTRSNVPVNVTNLTSGVASISVGWDTSCAVTTTGGAKCWGDNTYRGIGNGTNVSSSLPVDVTGLTSGVSTVNAGVAHTCAITTAYVAKCWGFNSGGQVGDGTFTIRGTAVNVAGGASYGDAPTAAVGPNIDLLWWAPGNAAGQTEILWTELESIS